MSPLFSRLAYAADAILLMWSLAIRSVLLLLIVLFYSYSGRCCSVTLLCLAIGTHSLTVVLFIKERRSLSDHQLQNFILDRTTSQCYPSPGTLTTKALWLFISASSLVGIVGVSVEQEGKRPARVLVPQPSWRVFCCCLIPSDGFPALVSLCDVSCSRCLPASSVWASVAL